MQQIERSLTGDDPSTHTSNIGGLSIHPRQCHIFASLSIAVAIFAASALAQSTIPWSTIDCGGGELTGGTYTTIAQPDTTASAALTGGTFSITGGFWPVSVPICLADFNNSGTVSVQDIFDFLALYFAGCP